MDVLTLYESLHPAVKITTKGGGEYAAPCPSCGGDDRFVLWPEHHSGAIGGRYLCRGCGAQGDAVEFLKVFQGMTYREACAELRVEPKAGKPTTFTGKASTAKDWTPEPERLPSAEWMRQAAAFAASCSAGVEAGAGHDYLLSRGLTVETAHKLGIGWNHADRYDSRSAWGLPDEVKPETGRPRKVWLPRGLVLPVRRKAGVAALLIRRADWKEGDDLPKYWQVKGCGNGCFCIGKAGLPVVLVESLLDAVLVWQEAGDVAAAVALTGASKKPDAGTAAFLKGAPCVLWSLDYDEAGRKVWPWWREHFPRARLWPCAAGKDLGDMSKAGTSIRAWVEVGLAECQPVAASCGTERTEADTMTVPVKKEAHTDEQTTAPATPAATMRQDGEASSLPSQTAEMAEDDSAAKTPANTPCALIRGNGNHCKKANEITLSPDLGKRGAEQWFPADPWAEQAERWPVSAAIGKMGAFLADCDPAVGIVLLAGSDREEQTAHDALPWVQSRAAALIAEMQEVDPTLRGVNIPHAVVVRRV